MKQFQELQETKAQEELTALMGEVSAIHDQVHCFILLCIYPSSLPDSIRTLYDTSQGEKVVAEEIENDEEVSVYIVCI
jgi:hypothetical protein